MPVPSFQNSQGGSEMDANTTRAGRPSRLAGWGHLTLHDYRMEITILERQNKRRQLMTRQEDDGTGGHTSQDGTDCSALDRENGTKQAAGINNNIGSVMDAARGFETNAQLAGPNSQLECAAKCEERARLLIVHLLKATLDNASQCLQQIPSWLQNRGRLIESLSEDEVALHLYQEQLNKQAEIDTLEEKYEGLAQLIPEAQQEELLNVKEKTKSTMQLDIKKLYTRREECFGDIQDKRLRDEELEVRIKGIKSAISETIEVLEALMAQVRDL